jgi:glycyl-tRNA synthetase
MDEIALNLTNDLRTKFKVFYDDKGAVGRRYRRMDEVGTPFCLTVDSQTLVDQTVTVRHRDSMEQERLPMTGLAAWLEQRLKA